MQPDNADIAARAKPRWQVASALGATQIFSFGTSYYLLGVLGAPIRAETGWSLAFLSGAQSVGMLMAGFVAPAVGRAISRRGGQTPLVFGFGMFALGLTLIGLAASKEAFLAGWLLLGIGMGASFYDGVFASLGKLYGASARPAIATVTLWGGFASTVCWPLSAALLEPIGWRGVCFVYAAIHLVLCIPLVLWSLAGSKPTVSVRHDETVDDTVDDRSVFYLVMAVFVANGLVMTMVYVHLIELLQARGLALAAAVSIGALLGPSQVGARTIDLIVGTRHHPIWTLAVSLGLVAIGMTLLAAHFPITAIAVALFAAGNGLYSIVRGALPLALFGPSRYAVVVGRLARPVFISQALAPTVGALMISRMGADATLWLLAVATAANLAAGAVLFAMVKRG